MSSEWRHYLEMGEYTIELTTPQRTASSRKLRPSGKRPEKMAAAESRSTLDLLPEDLTLLYLVKARLF